MLARSGTVRMPTIYGVMTHEEHPGPDVLLLERMRGVSVEAPAEHQNAGNNSKTKSLKPYWPGTVRTVAVASARSTILRKISGPHGTGNMLKCYGPRSISNNTGLTMQDKRILFRTRECLPALFEGFNDNCVLIHGNFCYAAC